MLGQTILIATIAIVISQQGSAIKAPGYNSEDSQGSMAVEVQQQASFYFKKSDKIHQQDSSYQRIFPYRRLGTRRGRQRSRRRAICSQSCNCFPSVTSLRVDVAEPSEGGGTVAHILYEDRRCPTKASNKSISKNGRVLKLVGVSMSEKTPELTGSEPISEQKLYITAFIAPDVRSDGHIINEQKHTKLDFYVNEATLEEQMELASASDRMINRTEFVQLQVSELQQPTNFEHENAGNEPLITHLLILMEPIKGSFDLRANRIFDDFPYNGIFDTFENQQIHEDL